MKNQDALVSVIVPVYGTETYLPACIDSIRNQSYKNIQIILVDDESPDRCPEICDQYAQMDSRIVVIHQKNKGVSGARNTGMNAAAGEYICFVDSDDELLSDAVAILMQDAKKYEADMVWTFQGHAEYTGADAGSEYKVYRGTESILLSLSGGKNMNAVWGKLFRTAFIAGISFEEGKNINEDGFFLFQCCLRQPILIRRNVSLYQYNIRPGSISRQTFSEKYFSMLYFCEKKKELIAAFYPQYMDQTYNMEVRTHLYFLDMLCRTTDNKYKKAQQQSIQIVRRLYQYHKPINKHHRQLAWIVVHGLYPLYKKAVRIKYHW